MNKFQHILTSLSISRSIDPSLKKSMNPIELIDQLEIQLLSEHTQELSDYGKEINL